MLAGRVVLVTGGATGIGFACCEAFGRVGAKVAIASRRIAVVNTAVRQLQQEGIDAFGVRVDVRDVAACEEAAAAVARHYGRLDFVRSTHQCLAPAALTHPPQLINNVRAVQCDSRPHGTNRLRPAGCRELHVTLGAAGSDAPLLSNGPFSARWRSCTW